MLTHFGFMNEESFVFCVVCVCVCDANPIHCLHAPLPLLAPPLPALAVLLLFSRKLPMNNQ